MLGGSTHSSAELVSPPAPPLPHHQGELSSTAPGKLISAAGSKGPGQFSRSLLHLQHQGQPAPVCCPALPSAAASEDQSQLSALMTPGPSLPRAAGRGLLCQDHMGGASSPMLMFLRLAHKSPVNRISPTVVSKGNSIFK